MTARPGTEARHLSEFRGVLAELGRLLATEARQMSIWLSVCVFLVTIGIGSMMIALIKRHHLAIESVVYGSIGSLKRLKVNKKDDKPKVDSDSNSDETTTTEVAFFPRYSVVNKSNRVRSQKKENLKKENLKKDPTPESKSVADVKMTNETPKAKPDVTAVETPQAGSLKKVFSTLRFKGGLKPLPPLPEKVKGQTTGGTSFYYRHAGNIRPVSPLPTSWQIFRLGWKYGYLSNCALQ